MSIIEKIKHVLCNINLNDEYAISLIGRIFAYNYSYLQTYFKIDFF